MRRPFLLLWEVMGGEEREAGEEERLAKVLDAGAWGGRVGGLRRSRGGPRTLQSHDTLLHASRQRLPGSRNSPPSDLFQHDTRSGTVSSTEQHFWPLGLSVYVPW